ncbi:hypothetical protein CPB86DRAFT_794353 [Serendipita vermifera]|nr:hypothetical protein CPB86DRAFT_794353 [Serendipita vermifera]
MWFLYPQTRIPYFVTGYILVSCIYCVFHLLPTLLSSKILPQSQSHTISMKAPYGITKEESDLDPWGRERLVWYSGSRQLLPKLALRGSKPYTTEASFLSKAFDRSMQPGKVVPFYLRATGIDGTGGFQAKDITIMTIVTSNRFPILGRLAQRYHGPISVAIHVTDYPSSHRDETLEALHDLYLSTAGMSTWVDVHLVIDPFDRQFNMWRNVARLFARTEFVMMLDVDFAICTDFRRRLLMNEDMVNMLRAGSVAFVVPAFEFTNLEDGRDDSVFPRTKEDLTRIYKENKIEVFHHAWEGGHNSSDYSRYFQASPGDVYKVQAYQHAYEPYVVFKRDGPPWCDERFIGYGGNKASCLYEMYLSGISFYVLSDDFLIHQSHMYAEDVRKAERRYNRQLYIDFRIEACLKSLHQSIVTNDLTSPRGLNVQAECQKIRGASALAIEDRI